MRMEWLQSDIRTGRKITLAIAQRLNWRVSRDHLSVTVEVQERENENMTCDGGNRDRGQ